MEGTTGQPALIKAPTTGMVDSDDSSGSFSQNVADPMTAIRDIIKDIRHQFRDPRYRTCKCGEDDCVYFCDMTQWLLPEMRSAVQPLEELYLALGELYKENKQLNEFVKVVEVPYQLDRLIGSTCSLLPRAWLLIGDIHFELHFEAIISRCSRDCSCKSERQDSGKWVSTTSNRASKDISGHMPRSNVPKFDQVASELISGDILKFLSISTKFDNAEDHISSAMHCYEEARKAAAAANGVDESTELKLLKKTMSAWIQLGSVRIQNHHFDAAGKTLEHAGRSLKEVTDNKTRAELLCQVGDLLSRTAEGFRETVEKAPLIYPEIRFQIMKLLSSFYSEVRAHYELSREALPGVVDICERLSILDINQRKPFLDSDNHQSDWSRAWSPKTLPHLYLVTLVDTSKILWCISYIIHDQTKMQRACLEFLLRAHHVNGDKEAHYKDEDAEVVAFWKQLQFVLKNMLFRSRSGDGAPAEERKKLSSMYEMSLRSPTFASLRAMDELWYSSSIEATKAPGGA